MVPGRVMLTVLLATAAPAGLAARTLGSENGPIAVQTVAQGLDHPWGIAFLPDGRMLVTERAGRLRIVATNGALSEPVAGVPEAAVEEQGGLLDVAIDPAFAASGLVYLSYAEAGGVGSSTAVARGWLEGNRLEQVEVIFRQEPRRSGAKHYGSRLVFGRDGTLFVTLGERFTFATAQDLSNDLGKVVRINPDGSIPQDNPFVGQAGARPEIWSYGHRNPQGAVLHPVTGELWEVEHGPRGGDELNVVEPGRNYGWPVVSWGRHYDGTRIPDPTTRPDLADAIRHWTPVISPSGMAFYTADRFPGWRGNLFIGGLSAAGIVRLTLDGRRVTGEERLRLGARIRDVAQGPDGALYALTDREDGEILRLTPATGDPDVAEDPATPAANRRR